MCAYEQIRGETKLGLYYVEKNQNTGKPLTAIIVDKNDQVYLGYIVH